MTKKQFPELPDWIFDIDEVSAGVYEVKGIDKYGHRLEFKGIDSDELLDRVRRKAMKITENEFTDSLTEIP